MSYFQGSIDEMKAEAETMIAAAKVEGEEIKRKGAEQVKKAILSSSQVWVVEIKTVLCTVMSVPACY